MPNTSIYNQISTRFRVFRQQALLVSVFPVALLLIEVFVFGLSNERFLSIPNLFNVMRQSAIVLLVAAGSS